MLLNEMIKIFWVIDSPLNNELRLVCGGRKPPSKPAEQTSQTKKWKHIFRESKCSLTPCRVWRFFYVHLQMIPTSAPAFCAQMFQRDTFVVPPRVAGGVFVAQNEG